MNINKVGVILGGQSSEREVSIRSGKAISKALWSKGYTVVEIGENGSIEEGILTSDIDMAFIALHGRYGEDGTLQKFLDDTGIPYTGSGPLASRFAMDKALAKSIFTKNNIPTPESILVQTEESYRSVLRQIKNKFGFPAVIKPVDEGSSIGLSIVKEEGGLKDALKEASKYSSRILIERYIPGSELTVGVLGSASLAVIHIVPKKGSYDYESKYTKGMTDYIFPADIPADTYRKAQFLGLLAHDVLGCMDFSRVDVRLSPDGRLWVLEVNTIPGFTETSLLPKAAKAVGIEFEDLCEKILLMAWERALAKESTERPQ